MQTRSRLTLRAISLTLVVIGLLVSGYLSYVKLTDVSMVCVQGGSFNCEVVQNSSYSEIMGIPIAWMGFATYIVLGVLLLLENRVPLLQNYGSMILFGITLFAWLFSMYLVYVQGVLLQAWCVWCLAHEANITVLFAVSILRLRNALR